MLKRIFFLVAFCNLLCFACTKQSNAPAVDLQGEFYPLRLGSVYIYDVDSTAYSDFTKDSVRYKFEIKDSIADTYTDLTGQLNYRVERYKRSDATTAWTIQRVFSRNKTLRAAEEFINNQRFVRLIFPPNQGSVWNGNSKNTIGKQDYLIEKGILPFSLNSFNFDSVITVKEIDEFNLIREDVVKATYAKNVGLVQKTVIAVDKNISTGIITNGTIYSYRIKAFH